MGISSFRDEMRGGNRRSRFLPGDLIHQNTGRFRDLVQRQLFMLFSPVARLLYRL